MTDLSTLFPQGALIQYLLALSVLGALAMLADKTSAMTGFDRISERNLALVASLAASPG